MTNVLHPPPLHHYTTPTLQHGEIFLYSNLEYLNYVNLNCSRVVAFDEPLDKLIGWEEKKEIKVTRRT